MSEFKEYWDFKAQIEEIEQQRKLFLRRLAGTCEVQPGDIVTVNGYAHKGKQFQVERVFVREEYFGGLWYTAVGPILKKDGTPGLQRGEWRKFIEGSKRSDSE